MCILLHRSDKDILKIFDKSLALSSQMFNQNHSFSHRFALKFVVISRNFHGHGVSANFTEIVNRNVTECLNFKNFVDWVQGGAK